jgi:hypothetical protein
MIIEYLKGTLPVPLTSDSLELTITEKIYNEEGIILICENAIFRSEIEIPKKQGYKFRFNQQINLQIKYIGGEECL